MHNLTIRINDENKILADEFFKNYKKRLGKFTGNYLEIGNYLIPFFKVPFLKQATAEIEAYLNISSSAKGYIRVDYDSSDYKAIREIKKGLIMKIDRAEENARKSFIKLKKAIQEKYRHSR